MSSHIYITYFDANYMIKGLAMITSLQRHDPACTIHVVCLDDETLLMLRKLALPGVVPFALALFEAHDPALQAAKDNRSLVEYYWTLTPTFILYLLQQQEPETIITYVDADLYFYSPLQTIFDEFGSGSIYIHRHNFPPQYKHLEDNGIFNVGLMCFRNDPEGLRVLSWWREQCLAWCYARCEDGKMGDQKYLESFQSLSPAVVVAENPGVGVAPWNQIGYRLNTEQDVPCVNEHPVVFYHYHAAAFLAPGCLILNTSSIYQSSLAAHRLFALPYLHALQAAFALIRSVSPDFVKGFKPDAMQANLCVLMEKEMESAFTELCPLRVPLDEHYILGVGSQLVEYATLTKQLGRKAFRLEHALTNYDRFPQKPRLVNLGCGGHIHQAWLNIDIAPGHPHVHAMDLRDDWPLPLDYFDMVYHSHVLEHMSQQEGLSFLRKCFAILKPGGVLRVAIPDLEAIARNYLTTLEEAKQGLKGAKDRRDWMTLELVDQTSRHHPGGAMGEYFKQSPLPEQDFILSRIGVEGEQLMAMFHGCPATTEEETDPRKVGEFRLGGEIHRWMYDAVSLQQALEKAGFINANQTDAVSSARSNFASFGLDADQAGRVRKPDSLFMEAIKSPNSAVLPLKPNYLPTIQYDYAKHASWGAPYADWQHAKNAARGYDDMSIFEKVYQGALQVKNGQARWERDSVVFHHEEYNNQLLESLDKIAQKYNGTLHVLDFGGSLGSTFVQHREKLLHYKEITWNVVEQQHFVQCGKNHFSDEHLSFFSTIEEAMQTHPVNVVLFSSVLQYLDEEFLTSLLKSLSQHAIQHIIFDRSPFRENNTRFTIEKPHAIYPNVSYPMVLYSLTHFDALMKKFNYTYVSSEEAIDGTWCDCTFLRIDYAYTGEVLNEQP